MSPLKTSFLIAILALSSACGRQVVEFKLDGGDGTDAPVDASIDAPVDGPVAVRPIVTSTMPGPDATGVALNTSPTATFSKPMNAGTLTTTTFTLRQGTTPLAGVVSVNAAGTTATFNPTADLTAGLVYTATITTGAQDTGGLALAANYTWMFTAAANALPPTVITTTPAPNASNVSLSVSPTATFSKAMNATTINMTTFTLVQGATPITGVVTLNSVTNTATFNPTANLTAGLVYTARITTGAQDTGGLALAADHVWTFTTGATVLPPTVTMTTPGTNATNVALGVNLTATFSQPMNPATITATTFTLSQGATSITGVVTYDALTNTATFNPTVDLTAGLVYTARVTTGAMDTGGLALAADYTWMFTTGTVVLPPTVTMTTPQPNATNVPANVSPTATFSRAMNATTINGTTFTVALGMMQIAGMVTYDALTNTATFNPTVDLAAGVYTATITTGAQDTNGVALAMPHTWMFTVGMSMLAPTVTMTTPLPNAMNVPINVSPTATFSRAMNMLTINSMTFTLSLGAMSITGMVSYDTLTNTATFDPMVDLAPGTYTATITTGAQDTNGVPLAMNHTWTFTVGASCVLLPIVLGTADPFAILAGSTVTNTGPSVVTGDLGVWMGTAVTGFGPGNGTLIGTEYAGTTPAMTAQGDLTIAYNDAAGRTQCLTSLIGELGGRTLAPGLYKSTSFMQLTTADLVLDAQGDANAIWIFSMVSSLEVANGRQVTIIGGGSAANVFWQVGSSAMIGTGVTFRGTIMADQAITMATGTVLEGRALARIAEVTLQSNTVTRP